MMVYVMMPSVSSNIANLVRSRNDRNLSHLLLLLNWTWQTNQSNLLWVRFYLISKLFFLKASTPPSSVFVCDVVLCNYYTMFVPLLWAGREEKTKKIK